MSANNLKRSNKSKRSYIFKSKASKSKRRQFWEAIVMLTIGCNLVGFLNTLPRTFITSRLSKETLLQLSSSFINIANSLATIGAALVVIILLIVSLILIIGALFRILIILNRKNKSGRHNKKSNLSI